MCKVSTHFSFLPFSFNNLSSWVIFWCVLTSVIPPSFIIQIRFSLSLFLTLEIIFSCRFSPHTSILYSIHGYSSKERQMKCSWQISHNGCPTPTYGCKIIYSISFRDLKCNDSLFCVTTFFSNEGYRYRCHLLHTATHKWFQIQMNAVKNQINKIYFFSVASGKCTLDKLKHGKHEMKS